MSLNYKKQITPYILFLVVYLLPDLELACRQTQDTTQITLGANSVYMSRWLFSDKLFQLFDKI